jgi:excisionase family DNA binding protein
MESNTSVQTQPVKAKLIHRRWLNTDQAADYLGCSKNFLDKDRSQFHRIPFSRLGRVIRYDINDLDGYLEAAKVVAAN